ncbi:MAG: hypothetical protein BGN88_03010 [Clostridiales bacterium 43-6]|nr:MAG: hypothetical protein BGN88_03010 [Clostridiales bacterium 43-6]
MRQRTLKRKKKIISVVLIGAALYCFCANYNMILPAIAAGAEQTAKFSALAVMPEGGAERLREEMSGEISVTKSTMVTVPVTTPPKPTENPQVTTKTTEKTTTNPQYGKVQTVNMSGSGYSFKWNNILVNNKTKSHTFNIEKELAIRPDINIHKNGKPQVLIMHTHATESYMTTDNGQYNKSFSARDRDNTKNMVRVGEEIKKQLDAAGIVTIHDKTQHDYPSYNGGYERSAATTKKYLKQYPSIDVVLDIHRDAITRDDGTKIKPTAVIGGKKAAQIMICAGCQDDKVTGFPDWQHNLRFALRLQKQCNDSYSGLVRPMYFVSKKYNEYLSRGSLLLEMGSDSNTLEEAVYSGKLLGISLAKVLNTLEIK